MQRQKKAAHLRRLFFGRNLLEGQSFGFDSPLKLLHAGFDHLGEEAQLLELFDLLSGGDPRQGVVAQHARDLHAVVARSGQGQ